MASSASSEAVSSAAESAVSEAASESAAASSALALEDGTYTAEFDTDSSMFHVNEASDGKGTLTVEDGQMTLHMSGYFQHFLFSYPTLTIGNRFQACHF